MSKRRYNANSNNRYAELRPGQFACLIKQCVRPECSNWFIGTPASRFCETCKPIQRAQVKAGWQRAKRNTGRAPHGRSRFSREEILEMRDMFHRMPAKEVAEHFKCHVALIYRYQKKDPLAYREK